MTCTRNTARTALAVALSATALHCGSSNDSGSPKPDSGSGNGGSAAGGMNSAGGSAQSGGAASGRTSNGASGTSNSAGGASAGGSSAGGASTGSGGATAGGGSTASGGSRTSGGSTASGGSSAGGTSNMGGASAGGAAGSPGRPGWNLVWNDEFDGPKDSAVDGSKWTLTNKGDGFGNNELEFYRSGTSNAALDGNGFLVITAKKESYMNRSYTSAKLDTQGKFDHLYGRFEARIKIPKGQGIWPAFWMLGNDIGTAGWPTCGEVDIMENIGKEPSAVHGSLHGPGGGDFTGTYTMPNSGKLADAFHVYAVEWEMNVVRFYFDDQNYATRKPSDLPSGAKWVYDHPFFIILNVAVGGNWPGSPDGTTQFPQTMLVDYVRVYAR